MSFLPRISIVFFLLYFFSCQSTTSPEAEESTVDFQVRQQYKFENLTADNEFEGARLNDFQQVDSNSYLAVISPENAPVNRSPWFAFRLISEQNQTINLQLKYTEHGHRYIPKLSMDGKNWVPLDSNKIRIDTSLKSAFLELELTSKPLYIAAQEILDNQQNLDWINKMAASSNGNTAVIGESTQGASIWALENTSASAQKAIAIIGRQHPPEIPGGTISLQSFVEACLAEDSLAQAFRSKFNIYSIPILNPDGVTEGHWRHNANGIDLNRDWQDFSQIETQLARTYFTEKAKDIDFIYGLDFHTSYSGPYLLVLDTLNETKTDPLTQTWINKIEQDSSGFEVEQRPRSQELPYCYNWMINEMNMEAVTFEDGDEIDRAIVRERAKVYAQKLMLTLLEAI